MGARTRPPDNFAAEPVFVDVGEVTMKKTTTILWGSVLVGSLAIGAGCGGGGGGQGPGGSNVIGNVSVAQTGADTTTDGIQTLAQGGGRQVEDLTDSGGTFQLIDAPTGEILVVFRRSGCEGSLPLGAVPSNSTIDLTNVSVVCPPADPFNANVAVQTISESFRAVAHEDGADGAIDLRLCVRVGDDNRVRTIQVPLDADVRDEGNRPIGRGAIREGDLLQLDGDRSGPGGTFLFDASRVTIIGTDEVNECDLP